MLSYEAFKSVYYLRVLKYVYVSWNTAKAGSDVPRVPGTPCSTMYSICVPKLMLVIIKEEGVRFHPSGVRERRM